MCRNALVKKILESTKDISKSFVIYILRFEFDLSLEFMRKSIENEHLITL